MKRFLLMVACFFSWHVDVMSSHVKLAKIESKAASSQFSKEVSMIQKMKNARIAILQQLTLIKAVPAHELQEKLTAFWKGTLKHLSDIRLVLEDINIRLGATDSRIDDVQKAIALQEVDFNDLDKLLHEIGILGIDLMLDLELKLELAEREKQKLSAEVVALNKKLQEKEDAGAPGGAGARDKKGKTGGEIAEDVVEGSAIVAVGVCLAQLAAKGAFRLHPVTGAVLATADGLLAVRFLKRNFWDS